MSSTLGPIIDAGIVRRPPTTRVKGLTNRVLELVKFWVLANVLDKQVGPKFNLSVKTWEKHRQNFYNTALEGRIHNRLEAAKWLLQHNHITVEELLRPSADQ